MSDEKKPGAFGKKPFKKSFGKKPFGAGGGKKFGDRGPRREGAGFGARGPRRSAEGGPRREGAGFGDRGPRRSAEGGPRREGGFGDRGPRREGSGFGAKRSFGDRGTERGGYKKFGNRGSTGGSTGSSSGPTSLPTPNPEGGAPDRPFRKKPFGDRGPRREGGFHGKPARNENSRYRGMYSGPGSGEQGEWKQKRGYRPDPRPEADTGPDAAPEQSGGERPHLAENELRYHGANACLALLKNRPQDIVRAYVLKEKAEELAPLIEHCAKNHLAYHLVEAGDLERLTDSIHHQGVCVIARAKRFFKEEIFFRELGAHRTLVIYLDGVANPHNLGAILRTAAHFGVKWVCVPADEISKISPALYRTAEGGAELVNMVRVEDTEKFLDRMRSQGFQLYAFEPGAKAIPLFETRLNEKSVFVFGAEVEGLSGLVKTIVETKVTIPGTGEVESLNVSVACAVAMAEFERQGQAPRSVRIVKSRS